MNAGRDGVVISLIKFGYSCVSMNMRDRTMIHNCFVAGGSDFARMLRRPRTHL